MSLCIGIGTEMKSQQTCKYRLYVPSGRSSARQQNAAYCKMQTKNHNTIFR